MWDTVLENVRIVLSTSQILVDALTHAFVKMNNIALLVFDEAHHVQANNSLNKMMQTFYHPKKTTSPKELPHILGLTASPIMGSDRRAVRELEVNLDAICISPRRHLSELMQCVYRPELEKIVISSELPTSPECLESLRDKVRAIAPEHDPYVRSLMKDGRPESRKRLGECLEGTRVPYCIKQLRALCRRADRLLEDLGPWAAEYFVVICAQRVSSSRPRSTGALSLEDEEKGFLADVLRPFAARDLPMVHGLASKELAEKSYKLLNFLSCHYDQDSNGIIFVDRRSSAIVLAKLISLHPLTANKYTALPFVGSTFSGRKADILDLTDSAVQKEALKSFRLRACNLIVATSVLEEGIDINATNLVIRFDAPQNLRSYIQSRGRARRERSRFVVFTSPSDPVARDWDELEQRMREEYQKERAILEERSMMDQREIGERTFRVERTGSVELIVHKNCLLTVSSATLTLTNAKSHLQNFCDRLSKLPYVNSQPEYTFDGESATGISATVVLPISVDPTIRVTEGLQRWRSERMASNDAAFEAYVRLYDAGLVNDNLLAEPKAEVEFQPKYQQISLCTVRERQNPWAVTAEATPKSLQPYQVVLSGNIPPAPTMLFLALLNIADEIQVPLFRSPEDVVNVTVRPYSDFPGLTDQRPAMVATRILLRSVFASRLQDKQMWETAEFPYMLLPETQRYRLTEWITKSVGRVDVVADQISSNSERRMQIRGLLRKKGEDGDVPYKALRALYKVPTRDQNGFLLAEDANRPKELHVEIQKVSRMEDFVRKYTQRSQTRSKYCPIRYLEMDCLPIAYSNFMPYFPGILHYVEIAAVAQKLSNTVLAPVGLSNINQIMDAISTPGSNGKGDYERLEFWGDCLLKYFVSLHLFTRHGLWPEGYLSEEKNRLVSNGRLCQAALDNNLDLFIQADSFASSRWRPLLLNDLKMIRQDGQKVRSISSKTLADVVEALLGATDLDISTDNDHRRDQRNLEFLKIFLPELDWRLTSDNLFHIMSLMPAPASTAFTAFGSLEERLLGYRFQNRLLLAEALTHPSCPSTSNIGAKTSYERVEFLGDSILDKIVVSRLIRRVSPRYSTGFPPPLLTILRSTTVNADLLGYFCLGFSFEETQTDITVDPGTRYCTTKVEPVRIFFWNFMRHNGSREIYATQDATRARYLEFRPSIEKELADCRIFPWALLAHVAPEKFYSDIIEAVLAAIFIDSQGDLGAAEEFLSRLGVLEYLERLLDAIDRLGEFKPGSNDAGIMIMQPKMQLIELAQAEQKTLDWSDIVVGEGRCFAGSIKLDGMPVGRVHNARSKATAEIFAADEAVRRVLEMRKERMVVDTPVVGDG